MPTSVTWNNTIRSIPNVDELNWQSLTNFLVDLGNNAQTTNFQRFGIRVATASPVTVLSATDCVVVTNLTVPGAVAVNLPAGSTGQVFSIVDGKGDAQTNNITITPAAGTINGAATYVLNRNRAGVVMVYTGSEWVVTSELRDVSGDFIPLVQKGAANGVATLDGSTLVPFAQLPTADAASNVVSTTGSQTVAAKTFSNSNLATANVTIASGVITLVDAVSLRVTGGDTSINNITSPAQGKIKLIYNASGGALTIVNDSGGTAANRILTGTGANLTLNDQASLIVTYDSTTARWRVIGGNATAVGTTGLTPVFTTSASVNAVDGNLYIVDSTSNAITVNLPTVGSGLRIGVIRAVAANTVFVDPNGLEQIDSLGAGVAYELRGANDYVFLYSNGVKWFGQYTYKPILNVTNTWTADQTYTGTVVVDTRVGVQQSTPSAFASEGNALVVGSASGARGATIVSATEGNLYFADGTAAGDRSRGIVRYDHTNERMSFGANNALAMYISSPGDVGIGTPTPTTAVKLTVTNGGTGDSGIYLQRTGAAQFDMAILNSGGDFILKGAADGDVGSLTEFFRVNYTGDVVMGSGNPIGARLEVKDSATVGAFFQNGAKTADNTVPLILGRAGTNDGSEQYVAFTENSTSSSFGSFIGGIRENAGQTAFEFFGASDARLKKNIKKADMDALSVINSLEVKEFEWEKKPGKVVKGLVAQEVEQVLPDMVGEFEDGMKNIGYSCLYVYFIKAIQELSAEVDNLKKELASIKKT